MIEPLPTRRQVVAGAFAASSLLLLPSWQPVSVCFPKGAPIPPWLEVSTKPGFFGMPVEIVEEFISGPARADFARMGYRDVPESRLTVTATAPLSVGDCLIRYKCGAEGDFRVLYAAQEFYRGRKWWFRFSQPRGTWMWTDDGSDKLLFAKVSTPEFRIVTPRLAERVVHSTA